MADGVQGPAGNARQPSIAVLFVANLLLAGVAWPALAQATTYTYGGAPTYSSITNFTPSCTVGPCANYTSAMAPSGSFTTATPLAANLSNVDIAALVTSFSFNDGINTYTSPNGRIITFHVYTDASGVPTASTTIEIQEWTTGSSPHASGDRFSDFSMDFDVTATNNIGCTGVGTSGGTADACISSGGTDSNSSTASNTDAGTWAIAGGPPPPPKASTTVTPVPTLSSWGVCALAMLVVMVGWLRLRRNRRA
jgi:hypothetical protein